MEWLEGQSYILDLYTPEPHPSQLIIVTANTACSLASASAVYVVQCVHQLCFCTVLTVQHKDLPVQLIQQPLVSNFAHTVMESENVFILKAFFQIFFILFQIKQYYFFFRISVWCCTVVGCVVQLARLDIDPPANQAGWPGWRAGLTSALVGPL